MGTKVPNLKTHSVLRGDTPSRCKNSMLVDLADRVILTMSWSSEPQMNELPVNRTSGERIEPPA
jgi:hypothetical protein